MKPSYRYNQYYKIYVLNVKYLYMYRSNTSKYPLYITTSDSLIYNNI